MARIPTPLPLIHRSWQGENRPSRRRNSQCVSPGTTSRPPGSPYLARLTVPSGASGEYTPAVARRGGQVEVVSPILFWQHSTVRPSRRSGSAPHPACFGLHLGDGRFIISAGTSPATIPDHRAPRLCRFCSVAPALTGRA